MLGDGGDDDPFTTFRGRSPSPERSPRGRSRSRDRGGGRDVRAFRRSRSRSRSPRRRRSRSRSRDRRRSRSRSRSRSRDRDRDRRDVRDDRRRHERDDRRGDRRDDDRRRDDRFDRHPPKDTAAELRPDFDRTNLPPPPPRAATAHHNPPPPRGGDPTPPGGDVHLRGVVSSVRPFGVFVRPDGQGDATAWCTARRFRRRADVRAREDSDDAKVMGDGVFPPERRERVGQGDRRPARRGTTGGNVKIALSMKLVDQADGKGSGPGRRTGWRNWRAAAAAAAAAAAGGSSNAWSDDPPGAELDAPGDGARV